MVDIEELKNQYEHMTTPALKQILEAWELGVKLMREELTKREVISSCKKFEKKK